MVEDLNGFRVRLDRLTVPELIDLCALLDKRAEGAEARVRAESAELIRRELVCPCESYQRMEAIPYDKGRRTAAHAERHRSIDHHDTCFFGEWAARIVEKGPKE